MSPFSSEDLARSTVRTVQIIVGALVTGVLVFAGIAVLQRINRPPQQEALLAYLGAGFAATALGVRSVIGCITAASFRKRIASGSAPIAPSIASGNPTDGDRLLLAFQQKTIIESALVEGAAFFVLVTFLTVGQWWSLGISAVLVVVLLVPFPTFDRVENWVKYQLELLDLERSNKTN